MSLFDPAPSGAAAPAPLAATPATPPAPSAAPADPITVDPLAALRDIHLPAPVPFWPPAPGWFMLAGALVLVALIAALWEWRRRQTLAYQAQQALKAIDRDARAHPDSRAVATAAALLVRRVLRSRPGRADAAALTGEAWQAVLMDGRAGMAREVAGFVSRAPYEPPGASGANAVERAVLVLAVKRWIRGNA